MEYLEFELPLAELESQIETLRKNTDIQEVAILQAIEKLKQKQLKLTQKIFSNLTDWQVIQLARHPERPYALDYIERVFSDFQELHGDRSFADDAAIVGGLARLNDEPVVVIGQQKGRDTKQKLYRNFGMPHPEGYRKALRLMQLAERFNLPVITLIDTPGAYPGIQAEARGQSEAIARNLREMAGLKVPIVSVVIGEGCSGGALGIGVSDVFLMMQYSYFATISPEGCATILWKSADQAAQAAEIMGITAQKLQDLKVVEGIVPEPLGGAHRDFAQAASALKKELIKQLQALRKQPEQVLLENRYQRLMTFGKFGTR